MRRCPMAFWLVPKDRVMMKNQKESRSANKSSKQARETARSGSETRNLGRSSAAKSVTKTSERIIEETSVKRRRAMTVLANR